METTPKSAEAPKSKSSSWKLIAIVVVILIVVGVAAYILTQKTTTSANVVIQDDSACGLNDANCLYNPNSFNATVNGSAVTWRNDGGVNHTVTTNSTLDASGLNTLDSGTVAHNGGIYSHTFTVKGTYHYYCTIHTWMKAIINVN